jgi:hypothetical protein
MRPDLEPLPARMRSLKIDDRGYPIPWFVAYIDGKPEFRAADAQKNRDAIVHKLCWVCGEKLGRYVTFVIGPMCGINRVSSEPPSHLECAQWSARNCPFLSNAARKRREDEAMNNENLQASAPGIAIARNPGATLLWTTREYETFTDGRGGRLIRIGEPCSVEFYANGAIANREQIDASIESGIPTLAEMAEKQGESAIRELKAARDRFTALLPQGAP